MGPRRRQCRYTCTRYKPGAVPLKKVGIPDNVGPMIAYLSSPAADFITGSEIVMDGGMLLV